MNRWLALVVLATLVLAAACGSNGGSGSGDGVNNDGRLRVVTTVSPITSIAENVGGTRIALEGIIPEGVNSHTFEPAPSVASTLAAADLIVVNGLDLEDPTVEMANANKKSDAVLLKLGDNTISKDDWQYDFSFPESNGHPNPHLWPNPMYALRYAELIHDELVQLDPDNAAYYDSNLEAFRARIEDLDARMMEATATVPESNRKLLTYHDSWAYWAPRYGFEVIGAVQPSDFAEPSASDVAALIDQINEEHIPAVFGSEVFPSDVLKTIADETGAEYIDKLADDNLPGKPGDPDHSYLGLMLDDMKVMIPALGGNVDAFDGFDPGPVFAGDSGAVYPQ